MAQVHPRHRGLPRPSYVPTAVMERLSRNRLPSDGLSEWEKQKLRNQGYDPAWLDSLTPEIVRLRIQLPLVPVPDYPLKVYKPSNKLSNK